MHQDELQRDSHYAHYLWHLHDAGVIHLSNSEGDPPRYTVESTVWDTLYSQNGAGSSLVAVIDNGCCTRHTHLPPGTCLVEAPCFASHDFGALYRTESLSDLPRSTDEGIMPETPCIDREGSLNHFQVAGGADEAFWCRIEALADILEETRVRDRLHTAIRATRETAGAVRAVASYAEDFSVHGTLTAGLVAARPPQDPEALPYFGADPRARVLALNTSLRPDARGLINALLYAVGRGADVLLLPRAIWRASEADPSLPPERDPRATSLDTDPDLREDGKLLDALLLAIGTLIPVILAAGNNGFAESTVYPASLAREGNGLISVGAINGQHTVSGYSNIFGVTIFAPSDDSEIWDRAQRRLDPNGQTNSRHAVSEAAERGQVLETWSEWSVLSTDIPGPFGDSSGGISSREGESAPNQSDAFASFGGTSAASAIAAGVVSMLQAASRHFHGRPMTGPEMKYHLRRHAAVGRQLVNSEPMLCIDASRALRALWT